MIEAGNELVPATDRRSLRKGPARHPASVATSRGARGSVGHFEWIANWHRSARGEVRFARTLVAALAVSIVPIIYTRIAGLDGVPPVLMIGFQLLSWLTLALGFFGAGARASAAGWLLAIAAGVVQAVPIVTQMAPRGEWDALDLAQVLARTVSVLLFVGLARSVEFTDQGAAAFVRGFLWLAIAAMVYNVVENAGRFAEVLSVSSSYTLNFSGFFTSRNQFGAFLFVSVVLHLMLVHRRGLRWFNWVLLFAQVGSMALTMSRGSLVATAVLFMFVVALGAGGARKMAAVMLSGISAVVTITVLLGGATTLVKLLVRPDTGVSGRDILWQAGLSTWWTQGPLFGVGPFRGVRLTQDAGAFKGELHNFYIETLVGGGLIGLVLVLGMLLVPLGRFIRVQPRSLWAVLIGGAAGMSIMGFFESIGFFSAGFVPTLYSLIFVALPLMWPITEELASAGAAA